MVSEPRAQDLVVATPDTRDRYVDFLRVAALVVVMCGHFLMAGVTRNAHGELVVTNSLAEIPPARLLTWIFQVLPVFFMVGGFSNAVGLASLRRRAGDSAVYADFLVSRCRRLLEPTVAFVVVGVIIGAVVELVGSASSTTEFALRLIGQPLWFVGIYLMVVALAPTMWQLHVRYRGRVVVMLVAGVVLVDIAHLGLGWTIVGYLNFALVWLAVHQLGFFYEEGTLWRRPVAVTMAVGGFALAIVLVAVLVYPVSMVSLPGERVSNLAPPSAALLALAFGQIGVLMLVRDPMRRWLQRPRVWTAVILATSVIMTAFLWHLTAIVIVNGVLVRSGFPVPAVGTLQWWLLRPVILALVVAVLVGLIAAFRRFEVPHPSEPVARTQRRPHRSGWAASGVALSVLGVLGFSMTGFSGVATLQTQTLVVLPMTPFVNVALLMGGWWIARWAARPVSVAPQPAPPSGR